MKKTLFIGLGGCGLQTVAQLSKKLATVENEDTKFMYLYIDTDEETRRNINATEELISAEDFVNLGSTNPYRVYDQATKGAFDKGNDPKYRRVLEWATSQEEGHLAFPNRPLADGAMAQRMVGRTGLVQNAEPIRKALTDRLVQFQKHQDAGSRTVEADVWVVTSSCGGTGSSLSIDVLYLINRISNTLQTQDAFVKLVLFMPEPFIDNNKSPKRDQVNNHTINGYSYLWELNAFKQRIVDGGKDIFSYFSAYPWGYKPGDQYDLFRYVIPVDVETNRNTKIGMNNLYSTTAEMIYYLNVGAGASQIVSNLCNDIVRACKPSSQLTKFSDSPYKWGTWLVPYGYHVIRKADLEFKEYLKTRATLEILRDGLLGYGMENNPKTVDEARRKFAATYVLPFLTDVDDVTAGDDSVQTRIDDEANVGNLNPQDLDATRVKNYLRKVDDALTDVAGIKDEYLEKIKRSINTGIGKAVAEHGLKYTITLLNNVDDIYLTTLESSALSTMESEADEESMRVRAEIEAAVGKGINKKNASAVAQACKKYFEARKSVACLRIVRKIIEELTVFPGGYLEDVRKGNGVDLAGLQKLSDMVNSRVSEAESAYLALARKFIASQSDALTVYLPSLVDIANGENGTWAQDNEFEKLYYTSILDYDHEIFRASGIAQRRVPVRLNGGSNNLTYYIQQMLLKTDTALFVNLAMTDPVVCQDKFDKVINEVLSEVLDKAVDADGTTASTWLKRSLQEYISINKSRIDFETLKNPDLIPVLYPMKASHTEATLTRYLYVGANKDMAEMFGFRDGAENTAYVEDKSMTDRFQIIKLPVGLDFYSYKYFNQIQDHYFKFRERILSEQEGCHIHKAFRFLDLDKSLKSVSEPVEREAIRYFVKNLYYQQVILELKEKEPAAYRDLTGQFDVLDFTLSASPSAGSGAAVNPLSQFMEGAPMSTGNVVDLGVSTVHDEFFTVGLRLVNPLGMNITMHTAGIDTDNHLYVETSSEAFRLADVRTPKLFADALLEATSNESSLSLMNMMWRVDEIEKALEQPTVKVAAARVKDVSKNAILTLGDANNPNFAMLLNAWIGQNNPDNELFLNEIRQFLNTVTR